MGRGGWYQIMQRMWFSHALKVINTKFYWGKFAVGTFCMAQFEVKRFHLEPSNFRIDQELRWGSTEEFADPDHIPGPHPGAFSVPIPQEHLQAVRTWFPKTQHPPECLLPAAWKLQNEFFRIAPTFPNCHWGSPWSAASPRAPWVFMVPLIDRCLYESPRCSVSQALLGADKTQVGFLCRWTFQKKQCPEFCRAFDNEKSAISQTLWSPLSCLWDFSFSFPFVNAWLIKCCFRSWCSGMALEDERKIFISFFCLWIRMFYLKKVPSAGLLMSYYPLWK